MYFVILAVIDLFGNLIVLLTHFHLSYLYLFFSLLSLNAVMEPEKFKPAFRYGAIIVVSFLLSSIFDDNIIKLALVIIHLLILFLFMKDMIIYYKNEDKINFFHIVLIFYEMTLSFKFLLRVFDKEHGVVFFYLTTFVEIFIAIYFTFFTLKKSPQWHLEK